MGILNQVRSEGYREGFSQASMVSYDDAFEKGRMEAEANEPSRLGWFLSGVVFAVGILLIYSYVL